MSGGVLIGKSDTLLKSNVFSCDGACPVRHGSPSNIENVGHVNKLYRYNVM